MRSIPKVITKELLEKLYIEENKSLGETGNLLKKSPKQVSRYLKKFGINARPFSTKGLKPRLGAILSEETKHKISKSHIGKKIPLEVRKKMGSKGNKNPGYIDGRTPKNKRIRHSIEFRLWREAVFQRDEWTCQECKIRGGNIHAHHIKKFADYPELRTSIENGITLCEKCHRKKHTSI